MYSTVFMKHASARISFVLRKGGIYHSRDPFTSMYSSMEEHCGF